MDGRMNVQDGRVVRWIGDIRIDEWIDRGPWAVIELWLDQLFTLERIV